ncbi:MAG: ABC transporter permease, partial [Clostridia bacterium]|nr:ABC transporter permease [Clostridia bacterium]
LRDNDYYVANYCLTKYRSVFGTPALAEKIILSTDKVSFERMDFSVKYFNDYERERETAVLNGKYKLNCRPGELPEGLTILYGDSNQLFYVRDTVVANLLGVPVEQVTPGFLESFFGDEDSVEMEFELTYSCSDHNGGYTYNFDYSATSTTVFHWDGDEDLLIIEMEDNGYAFSRTGGYCGPVLLLGRGVDENARQIAQLIPVLHDSSWWNDDPEKVETGYTIHSHFDDVLQRLDEYLKVNNSLFGRYAWLVAVFLAAAVFFYTTSSVKKNERSIGILRSVGVSRGGVMAVFASSSIGIMIASVPVAIVASLIILHKANSILSEGFGVELSVYFFDASAVGRSLLIIACSTVAAMLLTWLWLVIRKPVNMIYERRG